MKKEAVIFDMDGVISDTQKFHAEAESQLLAQYFDIRLSAEDITTRFAGVADEKMFEEILKENGIGSELKKIDGVVREKWDVMFNLIDEQLEPIPFAKELISELSQAKIKLAVASTSTHKFIERVLNLLNVNSYFQVIVSASDVVNGKPAPDIFLHASSLLDVEPNKCVVIEDGISGMKGANSAGMKSIGLFPKKDSSIYPATLLVTSLKEVNLDLIHEL